MQRSRLGGYTRADSGQRLGKHVPVVRQQFLKNATDYNNGRAVFSTWSVPRSYKQDYVWNLVVSQFLAGIYEERT
jgi:hypothetical protein